jgi:hypothetical protein
MRPHPRRRRNRCPGAARLIELGLALQTRPVQEAGCHDQRPLPRLRVRIGRSAQQCLRRSRERAATVGQASGTGIPDGEHLRPHRLLVAGQACASATRRAAEGAMHYMSPVCWTEDYVRRATKDTTPFLMGCRRTWVQGPIDRLHGRQAPSKDLSHRWHVMRSSVKNRGAGEESRTPRGTGRA